MPAMSGVDLIRALSEFEIKKVLLTFGPIQMADRAKLAYGGANEVLLKPVAEDRLKKVLGKYL
jgi:CheY-like chemotaxis protein